MAAQCGEQRLTAGPVDKPHSPRVPVELAAVEEIREGQLLQSGRSSVCGDLRGCDCLAEVSGQHEPADAYAGGQSLAESPRVHHLIGSQSLKCAKGIAVEPVLGIVVVFDDDGIVAVSPLQNGGATRGGQGAAYRPLVGG